MGPSSVTVSELGRGIELSLPKRLPVGDGEQLGLGKSRQCHVGSGLDGWALELWSMGLMVISGFLVGTGWTSCRSIIWLWRRSWCLNVCKQGEINFVSRLRMQGPKIRIRRKETRGPVRGRSQEAQDQVPVQAVHPQATFSLSLEACSPK